MVFENKIDGAFDNLAQRIIYPYVISYPEFIPIKSDIVSEAAQKQTNDFMKNTLISIYNKPEIIEMPIEKDDCFDNGVLYNTNPELNNSMKKLEKKFLEFFNFLFKLGLHGDVIDSKLHILKSKKVVNKNKEAILEQLGIICDVEKEKTVVYSREYSELCSGWKILSNHVNSGKDVTKQGRERLLFMKCLYGDELVPDSRLYGGLEQSGIYLNQLEDFLIEKGYVYNDNTLVKHYPNSKDGKFKVLFDWQKKNQLSYYFEIPGFTQLVRNHYSDMDDKLKELVFSRLNDCNKCGYCIQTGKHQLLATSLKFNGETSEKCPFFPNLKWDRLDKKSVASIKNLIEFSISIL